MTDKEIIKALECHQNAEYVCPECPLYSRWSIDCVDYLSRGAVDLIKRQQAEINQFADIGKMYSEVKADVVREFAEKLKEKFSNLEYDANTTRKTLAVDTVKSQMDWVLHEVTTKEIDNLVNEFFGISEELKGE